MSTEDPIRILHVDDDRDFADMAATFLEREDERFTIQRATSAKDGLEHVVANRVDCIVSDHDMPGWNGIEFLEAVREDHPRLPFILFTGKGSEEVASEALTAGATDYLRKNSGSERYELLANRIRNAVEQYRANERARNLERIRGLIADVNQGLIRAESREALEEGVCETISSAEPYLFAWIGAVDEEGDTVSPRISAGIGEDYLDEIEIAIDDSRTGRGPTGRAVRTREIAVQQNILEGDDYEPWREDALEEGYRSSAAVPLIRDETWYGVLSVYADRPNAFDDPERDLLVELGDDIAHALHRIENQRDLRAFREVVEQTDHVIYWTDPDGRIQYVNEAFEESTGYLKSEAIGRNPRILKSGEQSEAFYSDLWETITAGNVWHEQMVDERRSGDTYVVDQSITPVLNEDGDIDRFVAVSTDMTEQRERERELELYEAVCEQINDEVYFLAADSGTIESTNGAAKEHLGYHTGELVDTPIWELLVDIDDASEWKQNVEPLRGNDGGRFETEYIRADGTTYPVAVSLSEVTTNGDRYIVLTARDISTRRKQERELQRQNERLDQFASVLSHDLRNPLTVAKGRMDLLRNDCDSEHISPIERSLGRMDTLIEDILAAARGGLHIEGTSAMHLGEVCEDTWQTMTTADARLEVQTDLVVHADRSRLQQLLTNLFQNAIDHAGDGATIRVGDIAAGFYVADDGPGIPPAEREQIFETGYTTSDAGTGLGLNIVKNIAEAHGWEVEIGESAAGGTRVEFTNVTRS